MQFLDPQVSHSLAKKKIPSVLDLRHQLLKLNIGMGRAQQTGKKT